MKNEELPCGIIAQLILHSSFFCSSFKYREVHTAIYPSLYKVRMIFEVIFLSMFQYKQAFLFQEVVFEDKIRNGFQSLQFVWRIGKDKIELFTSSFDEFEYIATDRDTFIGLYLALSCR